MYSAKEILKTLGNHFIIFTGFTVTDHLIEMLSFHECYLRDLFKKSQLQSQASRPLKQSQPLYKIQNWLQFQPRTMLSILKFVFQKSEQFFFASETSPFLRRLPNFTDICSKQPYYFSLVLNADKFQREKIKICIEQCTSSSNFPLEEETKIIPTVQNLKCNCNANWL